MRDAIFHAARRTGKTWLTFWYLTEHILLTSETKTYYVPVMYRKPVVIHGRMELIP